MKKFTIYLFFILLFCQKQSLEQIAFSVKPSLIPSAGKGVFARQNIKKGTYLFPYRGRYINKEETDKILQQPKGAYLFNIKECAYTRDRHAIDGDLSTIATRINFAPSKINGHTTFLQNVEYRMFCQEPLVRIYASRDIKKGEELYMGYGYGYDYDEFMQKKSIRKFFLQKANIPPAIDGSFHYEP